MRHFISRFFSLAVVALALQGCNDRPAPAELAADETLAASLTPVEHTGRHIVLFAAERVPPDFVERVERLGGTVSQSLDSIGVGVVDDLSPSAAAILAAGADVRAVEPDVTFQLAGEEALDAEPADITAETLPTAATASPTAATLYPRQWNMRAIGADAAWDAGYLGSPDVKVVILDTGIDYLHPELQGLVDLSLSRSFVPAEDSVVDRLYPGRNHVTDLFWHGTAMAATVASNAKRLAGVTQHVTLITVKVANRFAMSTLSAGLAGVVYAADQGADIMNVSGGMSFRVSLPCEAPNAICISATGPTIAQSINGPWDDVDASALYTGYGRSVVSVAAPGGQRFTNTRVWVPCLTTPSPASPAACRAAPMCPTPSAGTCLNQGIGTSFSAAHTTGLAALLVQQLGHGKPAQIRERILRSADDLGEPGTDPYYGRGRINVARALGLIP